MNNFGELNLTFEELLLSNHQKSSQKLAKIINRQVYNDTKYSIEYCAVDIIPIVAEIMMKLLKITTSNKSTGLLHIVVILNPDF